MTARRHFLVLAAFSAFWPCYSFSDPYTYGTTSNAAALGSTWTMTDAILGVPAIPGMDINGVLYRYTTVKDPDDPFTVTIQNEDTEGGYIFSETDDWSGLPGNTINKYIPLELTPISRWGDGEIATEGQGEVQDPTVVYTYRFDECFNAEITPGCPGYIDPTSYQIEVPEIEIYDALNDDAVVNALAETDPSLYEDEDEEAKDEDEEDEKKEDLEKGLAAVENALTLANNVSQETVLRAMNASVNMNTYYVAQISGGAYPERNKLVDTQIPDNGNGLRNGLAQQLLHNQMVDMQYEN
jgi:hypothetical protein